MKRYWVLGVLLLVVLFSGSCKDDVIDYEAYLTIVNIGNVDINAAVEDQWETIPAYSSLTWAILLDDEYQTVEVLAEAEPVDYDDYDSEVIRLSGDRDVKTWLVGWDEVAPRKLKKMDSTVLSGQQDVSSLITRYRP